MPRSLVCPDCGGPKYAYAVYCMKCKAKGERNGMFGKKHSESTRAILAEQKRGRELPERRGELHPMWKGDAASPGEGRFRAEKLYPLKPCEVCGSVKSERHHRDENPLNNTPGNIQFLCRRHHKQLHAQMRQKPCAADGCDRVADSRGFCTMHYQRIRAQERRESGAADVDMARRRIRDEAPLFSAEVAG